MISIFDLTKNQLNEYIDSIGEKKYRVSQIFDWLHNKNITKLDDMSNINKDLIDKLKNDFDYYVPTIIERYKSHIDDTIKYLIKLIDGNIIETVLMRYKYGFSICISSQVGCNMGCSFCASTIDGLQRNLHIYELLWQIYAVDNDLKLLSQDKISHIVIMGTGEPLNNFDSILSFINIINDEDGKNLSIRNITISTCGIVENIKKLATKNLPITLALSLHAPNNNIRRKLMPIAKKYDIDDVVSAMSDYNKNTKRNITFEYILIDNINDSKNDAHELAKLLLRHIDKSSFNINLIPINTIKESDYKRPNKEKIKDFISVLNNYNINNTIRRELGQDISGSCGQLRYSYKRKES